MNLRPGRSSHPCCFLTSGTRRRRPWIASGASTRPIGGGSRASREVYLTHSLEKPFTLNFRLGPLVGVVQETKDSA